MQSGISRDFTKFWQGSRDKSEEEERQEAGREGSLCLVSTFLHHEASNVHHKQRGSSGLGMAFVCPCCLQNFLAKRDWVLKHSADYRTSPRSQLYMSTGDRLLLQMQ